MSLFRRRHTSLSDELLHEAGLDIPERKQRSIGLKEQPDSVLDLAELAGGGFFEAFVIATVPAVDCDVALFWALPDGELLVAERVTANLSGLADAVEKKIERPYRAVATRQDDKDLWAIGAQRVDIVRFEFTAGDSLLLGKGDTTELLVDGKRSDAPVPAELMAAGERHRERFQAEATRLEGDLWEVLVSAL